MPQTDIVVLPKEVEIKLNYLLNLPATGVEQDWEIELSDKNRIQDFIDAHNLPELDTTECYGIGRLILASYNDYLEEAIDENSALWNKIAGILDGDSENYTGILRYWACFGSTGDDVFRISEVIRVFLNSNDNRRIEGMVSFFKERLAESVAVPAKSERPNSFIGSLLDIIFQAAETPTPLTLNAGCSSEEIAALEAHYNLRLPGAFKVFLSLVGHGIDTYEVGTDYTYNWLFDQTKAANELLDEKNILPLPGNVFSFSMHQGYQFCCFFVEEGIENPSVYYYHEVYASHGLMKVTDHLTEYLMNPNILNNVLVGLPD